ncbi:MAG: cupin domain-containing protein [Methanomassiliicoccales archaeon]|nr:cupin domain-containing protein [Methanomassiliicoccales archaeon]
MPVKKEEKGDIVAKRLVMTDLIDYQDGAVVSRTLVDKRTGTVTLFAFDGGQGLSEHSAPFDALIHVLDGRVEIKIDGVPQELGVGEMIILPAEHPHAVRALSPFKMILTMVRSEPKAVQIQPL